MSSREGSRALEKELEVAMPSVEDNLAYWDGYDWSKDGEEWSSRWGGSDAQWVGSIFPRIRRFLPANTILEIGSGLGRWTQYLKDYCKCLIAVDLSPTCVDACRLRFKEFPHIQCHANDGKSLAMIPDRSIDFAFSFDSLVHADAVTVKTYLHQLATKFAPNGFCAAFELRDVSARGSLEQTSPLRCKIISARNAARYQLQGNVA
jgi:SAM-dependent methyltransferase